LFKVFLLTRFRSILSRHSPAVASEQGKRCKTRKFTRRRALSPYWCPLSVGLIVKTGHFCAGLTELAVCVVNGTNATRAGGSDGGDCAPHATATAVAAATRRSIHNCSNATVERKGTLFRAMALAARGGSGQSVTCETIVPNGKLHFSYFGRRLSPTVRPMMRRRRPPRRRSIWWRRKIIANTIGLPSLRSPSCAIPRERTIPDPMRIAIHPFALPTTRPNWTLNVSFALLASCWFDAQDAFDSEVDSYSRIARMGTLMCLGCVLWNSLENSRFCEI
jgi:hypothetical protein